MKRSYRSVRLVKSTVFIAYSRKRHFSLACFDRCMLSFVTKCNPKFCRLFHHSGVLCIKVELEKSENIFKLQQVNHE